MDLITNIVAGLIVAVIAAWLGIGAKSERVVFAHGGNSGKKRWKKVIILAWLMIVLGIVWYVPNAPPGSPFSGAFLNGWAVWGFDFIGLGLILLVVAKIFLWLNS